MARDPLIGGGGFTRGEMTGRRRGVRAEFRYIPLHARLERVHGRSIDGSFVEQVSKCACHDFLLRESPNAMMPALSADQRAT
jgi:hypothetical protein